MKYLLICLLLACSFALMATTDAQETRLFGMDRQGQAPPPLDLKNLTAEVRGFLKVSRIGWIRSVSPFEYEDSIYQERPEEVVDLVYESLLAEDPTRKTDRFYPLIAQSLRVPADYSHVVFELDPRARFNDGISIRGTDVAFSYQIFKSSQPELAAYLARTVKSTTTWPNEVRFDFHVTDQKARDAILLLSQMKIVRMNTTGNPEMGRISMRYTGSGPYQITQLGPGRAVMVRNQFYWGEELPSRAGLHNLRQIDVVAFASRDLALNALVSSAVNFYFEDRARAVSETMDALAARESLVKYRQEIRSSPSPVVHAFAFNLNRPHLNSVRVRQALMLAYDFTLINQLYHEDQLERPSSLLAALPNPPSGPPNERVRALLDACALPTPSANALESYGNNLFNTLPDKRTRLAAVMSFLREAGYMLIEGKLRRRDPNGELQPLELKFVGRTATQIDQLTLYKNELEGLGIQARVVAALTDVHLRSILATGDYDLAPIEMSLLSNDLGLRPDLARALFESTPTTPHRLGTAHLHHLNLPCMDALLEKFEAAPSTSPEARDAAEAIARIEQLLYLSIYTGESRIMHYFIDRRLLVPATLSTRGIFEYGIWDQNQKE